MAKYNITEKKEKTPLYRSLLSPAVVEKLYEQIMQKFVVEKKYRDANYSAQVMADELGTNTRYISAVINLRYQDNYSQMVNEFRIKEAMYLLKDPHCERMTMEDIALKVGFANRQSFYAAFYKRNGQTPRDFRKDNVEKVLELMEEKRRQTRVVSLQRKEAKKAAREAAKK